MREPNFPFHPGSEAGGSALGRLAASIQNLIPPGPGLLFQCNRERVEARRATLAAIDVEIESLRRRAFAAAMQLAAVEQPAP